MSSACRIAFIGAGTMSVAHIQAFKDIKGVDLSGITSRTLAKADALAKEYGIKHVCASIGELYKRTQADLVVISVPVLETHAVCAEAFKHPWKMLIEKPVGYDFNESLRIQRAAEESGSEAFVALNRRQYASTRTVLEGLNDDEAKRLKNIDARVFFWPLSSLPMFEPINTNIHAWSIPERAINLPSYHDLTHIEQDRIVSTLHTVAQGESK